MDKAQTNRLPGVPEAVWNFHIGGYQVCEKWLKDRKGRTLSKDDIAHYQKIVVALSETIRLMKEIDEVIEQHGGWPAAFVSTGSPEKPEPISASPNDDEAADDDTAFASSAQPLLMVAEGASVWPTTSGSRSASSESASDSEWDEDEWMAMIRQVFGDGEPRDRERAVRELARELGYQRTGSRIGENLDNAIRTAVRRGILENQGSALSLYARSIESYERDFLKDQFVASLQGRVWKDRDDAIRGFARWLGFRRTGPQIDETARSLVNGLIREGRLESDGPSIRRT